MFSCSGLMMCYISHYYRDNVFRRLGFTKSSGPQYGGPSCWYSPVGTVKYNDQHTAGFTAMGSCTHLLHTNLMALSHIIRLHHHFCATVQCVSARTCVSVK